MITTTLNRIREHNPCVSGWAKLLSHLGKTKADDEPLPYSMILDAVGLADTLWCLRAEPQHAREWRLYAVWCARQVQHLMADPRSIAAIDMAERYEHGEATDEELQAARDAAWNAAWNAAWDVACAAAEAAWAAAAWAAAEAADMAWAAALPAQSAARTAQEAEFRRIVG